MVDTKVEARRRVLVALRCIEDAQSLLSSACQELSSITGGASVDHRRVLALYDKIKAEWYRIDERFRKNGHKYDLDATNAEAFAKLLGNLRKDGH